MSKRARPFPRGEVGLDKSGRPAFLLDLPEDVLRALFIGIEVK